jgi:hypothetical protein
MVLSIHSIGNLLFMTVHIWTLKPWPSSTCLKKLAVLVGACTVLTLSFDTSLHWLVLVVHAVFFACALICHHWFIWLVRYMLHLFMDDVGCLFKEHLTPFKWDTTYAWDLISMSCFMGFKKWAIFLSNYSLDLHKTCPSWWGYCLPVVAALHVIGLWKCYCSMPFCVFGVLSVLLFVPLSP